MGPYGSQGFESLSFLHMKQQITELITLIEARTEEVFQAVSKMDPSDPEAVKFDKALIVYCDTLANMLGLYKDLYEV